MAGDTGGDAEDVHEVGGGDTGVGEDKAVCIVLGAGLNGLEELVVGPALGLDLLHVHTGVLEHLLVAAQGLDGQVQGQAVQGVVQGHVVQGVLVVVGQRAVGQVVGHVDGHAHLHEGTDDAGADLGDVRGLAGQGHGGQLGVVVVPGGGDDLHLQVGILLLEVRDPAVHQVDIVAGDGRGHDDDGVLRGGGLSGLGGLVGVVRGLGGLLIVRAGGVRLLIAVVPAAGGQAQDHAEAEKQCKKLFHVVLLNSCECFRGFAVPDIRDWIYFTAAKQFYQDFFR